MDYIPRLLDKKLFAWATSLHRKPLLLRGARQVGKTAMVRQLAESLKLSLCEINFERMVRLRKLFTEAPDLSPSALIPLCNALLGTEIKSGKTLLFLDEIQESEQAITALRYFYEEMPDLHIIAAGSLLEFTLQHISIPVGRISFLYLRPMTFEEFLEGTGRSSLNKIRPNWTVSGLESSVPLSLHDALRDALKEYLFVGGMPACVAEFAKTRNLAAVRAIQSDIVQTYTADVRKYAKGNVQIENVGQVMTNAFSFVGKQISYTALGHGDAIKRTKQSVRLLAQAQIIQVVKGTSAVQELPLSAHSSDKIFKLVFLDVGLGLCLAGIRFEDIISESNLNSSYEGKITEQFVGQELIALEPNETDQLYYWYRNEKGSSAEVDYLLSRSGEIFPLEVKSGSAGRLKSLHLYLSKSSSTGICLQDSPRSGIADRIHFWPLYTNFRRE